MGKRDLVVGLFRKDRASTPSPRTPQLASAVKSSASSELVPETHRASLQDKISLPSVSTSTGHPEPGTQRSVFAADAGVNPALQVAIQRYFDELPEAEKDAFLEAPQNINQDSLLSSVRAYDEKHKHSSSFRPRTKDISKFLNLLNRCMVGISTAIQANSDPSSIIVGAAHLVIGMAVLFVNFFDRLTDMLNSFNDYFLPLTEYAKASEVELMLQTIASVYGDLLEFCSAARRVFVNTKGLARKRTTRVAFLRVQWEPFEIVFGDVETRFEHHMEVLLHSAEAFQVNTLRIGLSEAEKERLRLVGKENMDQKEAFLGWICSSPPTNPPFINGLAHPPIYHEI